MPKATTRREAPTGSRCLGRNGHSPGKTDSWKSTESGFVFTCLCLKCPRVFRVQVDHPEAPLRGGLEMGAARFRYFLSGLAAPAGLLNRLTPGDLATLRAGVPPRDLDARWWGVQIPDSARSTTAGWRRLGLVVEAIDRCLRGEGGAPVVETGGEHPNGDFHPVTHDDAQRIAEMLAFDFARACEVRKSYPGCPWIYPCDAPRCRRFFVAGDGRFSKRRRAKYCSDRCRELARGGRIRL